MKVAPLRTFLVYASVFLGASLQLKLVSFSQSTLSMILVLLILKFLLENRSPGLLTNSKGIYLFLYSKRIKDS